MKNLKRNIWPCFLVLMVLSFFGCAMDEYHIEGESYEWHYEGLADDTTAVVSVVHREGGHIECHHFMSYDDGESFSRDWLIESIELESFCSLFYFIGNCLPEPQT